MATELLRMWYFQRDFESDIVHEFSAMGEPSSVLARQARRQGGLTGAHVSPPFEIL